MASIRRRNGKWQAQVRKQGHAAIARSFTNRANARSWAQQIEAEIDKSGLPVNRRALATITLGDLLRKYRDTYTPKKRGAYQEAHRLNCLLRHPISSTNLRALTPATFASYRDQRLESVKGATVLREFALLRHVLEMALREWGVPLSSNPLDNVTRPKPDTPRERRLNPGELDRVLEACDAGRNRLLKFIILLAIETGMRRSELLNIEWHHVDLDRRTLHIPTSKNGRPRTIPLTTTASQVLSELSVVPVDAKRVFPVTPNAVRLAWERLRRRAGIDDLRFHDLRHEAITRFFEMGLSVPEVALISGHRDYRMLARYTHLRAEDLVEKLR
ncbi:MAG TPA: site-specific integrase [Alphaproteobacteria bacterium]|nr:site-specific integrase [Alphaproteobacteria bacterium]